MNSKHRRTLTAVFRVPISASIVWADVEALLIAAGCVLVEGKGSHVTFVHRAGVLNTVRPHPAKEAKRYQVRDVARLLTAIGVTP